MDDNLAARLVNGSLTVRVLDEGVHSGDASGIVPSSFRILRQLLSRLENEATGEILPEGLHMQIPADRRTQASLAAKSLGDAVYNKFPFAASTKPLGDDRAEMVLKPHLAAAIGRGRDRWASRHAQRG